MIAIQPFNLTIAIVLRPCVHPRELRTSGGEHI